MRQFASSSLNDLISLCSNNTEFSVLEAVLHELSFRKSKGAKRLEANIRQKLADNNAQQGLTFGADTRTSGCITPDGVWRKARKRARPIKGKYAPTEEQTVAIDKFMSGKDLKVIAFAGAGKTSTLTQMANVRDGRGLYLAFNRAIAEEAGEEFPRDVDCRTTHSLALRSVRAGGKYTNQKLFQSIRTKQLAHELELKPVKIAEATIISDLQQAAIFLSTIRRFCQSGDDEISQKHTVLRGRLLGLEPDVKADVKRWLVQQSQSIWNRMIDGKDELPMGHDGYLKLWSLNRPILDKEYVLLDEAQDTNPAVMSVLENQKCQLVYVGDKHQQIYAWRGAHNAMASVDTPETAFLTQSFRFGDKIAVAATGVLRTLGEEKPVKGFKQIQSDITTYGQARTVLARTNSKVISEVLDCLDTGHKPHIVGGTDELLLLVGAVFSLMDGQPSEHPDFFGFSNWDQVVAFSETDEGEDIKPFVTLVQKYGPRALYAALKSSEANEDEADVIISTAHKSKGRQWKSVRIADDFSSVRNQKGELPEEESRLFYVAITRAQEQLILDYDLLLGFVRGVKRPLLEKS